MKSQDGNGVFMGLKGSKLIFTDTRLPNRSIVGDFDQKSVGWVKVLKSDPNLFLAENFDAEVKIMTIVRFSFARN